MSALITLLSVWVALCALLAWGLSKWFRYLRDCDLNDLDGAHDSQARFGMDEH